jgi:D-beta-D-heptose 7-phosphate kinase/D-beta-D-heptose 1-phosphate adenosyltransferase
MNILQPKKFNILLIGDDCKDIYVYGIVTRLSPEAPVPVFQPDNEVALAGMAGNVAKNLQSLNCQVDYLHCETSIKTRLIDQRSKQHIVRIDQDAKCRPLVLTSQINDIYHAVVISDYDKGTVTTELIQKIRQEYSGPIFVDTKKTDLSKFDGCYIKINQLEFKLAKTFPQDKWLIVTNGSKGALYMGQNFASQIVNDVVDVCGAGDTFLAALAYQYLITNNIGQSIMFANRAAGITIQHLGAYAPTLQELL